MKTRKPAFNGSHKIVTGIIGLSSFTKTGAADWRNHNTRLLLEEAQKIVKFAKDEVNFAAEINTLQSADQSEDIENIVTAISEAKESAAEKLESAGYQEFCRYLLKKQGLLREGD
jgi:hypothetical protein